MAKQTTKASSKPELASREQLSIERKRAEALAKQYQGNAEMLTLKEASAEHPDLEISTEDMANTAYFHLRFRPCSICGRFPSRAIVHYALHENGTLDAKGHVTDPAKRKTINERVAKALATLAAEKAPKKAKPAAKAAKKAA